MINVVIQMLIQPKVVGDSVQLNTTLTFLALIIWTFLLGGLGAILAIPMTLLIRALFIDSSRAPVGAGALLQRSATGHGPTEEEVGTGHHPGTAGPRREAFVGGPVT